MTLRDRICGCFLGVALGDTLGAPVETFSAKKIQELFGRVEDFVSFDHSKYLKGQPIGTVTDDTQLTLAVAEAIIECGVVDLSSVARAHVRAYQEGPVGWG